MNIEEILQKGIDSLNDKEREENYKNFIGGIEYSKEKILPYLEEKDKEIERLNSIIKEVREYIYNKEINTLHFNSKYFLDTSIAGELLEILDKVEEGNNE